jgi:subtilisin family serine protease
MFMDLHQSIAPAGKIRLPLIVCLIGAVYISGSFAQLPEAQLADGTSYVANRVVVLSKPDGSLKASEFAPDGLPATGITSLDQLGRQLGVVRVDSYYPGLLRRPELARLASRLRILTLQPGRNALKASRALTADPHLASAGLQILPNLLYTPNDFYYPDQWHLPQIQAPAAWDYIRSPQTRHAVVAIIDTGLQLEHAEIQDNLWVNEPEDLNHNGRLDPEDINGIDDDGNGFIDDVVGWDFAGNDNDPQEIHPHGTGTAACVSAVTDNGTLGAAIGFGVRLMAVKAISDHGQLVDGYISMLYAADNGAQIINCSWGLPFFQEYEQAIIDAVWAEDVVIVAAGGEADALTYPAAYDNVVAVSATDQYDHITPFSPYGDYIDICAPGVNILTVWEDDFTFLSGNSFSTGIVSGTIGLLRAQHPQLDNAATVQLMKQSADPIDELNPGYAGLLGAGRINAFTGVVSAQAMDESAGTSDGHLVCSPNPFNARTQIGFRLAKQGRVTVVVYDSRGRQVATLIGEVRAEGYHEVSWDAGTIASGTYFLVLTTPDRRLVRKLSLVK